MFGSGLPFMHVNSDTTIQWLPPWHSIDSMFLSLSFYHSVQNECKDKRFIRPSIYNIYSMYDFNQHTNTVCSFKADAISIPSRAILNVQKLTIFCVNAYQSSPCCNTQRQHFHNGASPETQGDESNPFKNGSQLSCVPHAIQCGETALL